MGDAAAITVIPGLMHPEAVGPTPSEQFLTAVARVYELGFEISFEGLFAAESRRRVSLPEYPFERQRYWMEARQA